MNHGNYLFRARRAAPRRFMRLARCTDKKRLIACRSPTTTSTTTTATERRSRVIFYERKEERERNREREEEQPWHNLRLALIYVHLDKRRAYFRTFLANYVLKEVLVYICVSAKTSVIPLRSVLAFVNSLVFFCFLH